uniref:Uncharacterized protein n=1 Tax=Ciona savignyi TaxID=51511 RepID=H2Z4R0_CIOSA
MRVLMILLEKSFRGPKGTSLGSGTSKLFKWRVGVAGRQRVTGEESSVIKPTCAIQGGGEWVAWYPRSSDFGSIVGVYTPAEVPCEAVTLLQHIFPGGVVTIGDERVH